LRLAALSAVRLCLTVSQVFGCGEAKPRRYKIGYTAGKPQAFRNAEQQAAIFPARISSSSD